MIKTDSIHFELPATDWTLLLSRGELAQNILFRIDAREAQSTHRGQVRLYREHGMLRYVYGHRVPQLGCDGRGDISDVYVIALPPPNLGGFCPVTSMSPCQLRVGEGSSALSTEEGEQCLDCNPRCADAQKRIERQLNSISDNCGVPGAICGTYTWFKTAGPGGIADTLGEFINACFVEPLHTPTTGVLSPEFSTDSHQPDITLENGEF